MSSLKSLLFLAFLGATACGVYVMLNRNTESPVPPGISEGAPGGPIPLRIEMPPEGPPGQPAAPVPPGVPAAGAAPLLAAPAPPSAVAPGAVPPVAPGLPSPPLAAPPTAATGLPTAPAGPERNNSPAPAARDSTTAGPPPAASDNTAAGPAPLGPGLGCCLVSAARDNPTAGPAPAARDNPAALKAAVMAKLDQDRVAEAHLLLSSLYGNPTLPPNEAREVTRMLDQMAATVIYSRQHWLEPACRVQAGDTLDRIAARYDVPPQLLARINGIRDPQNLSPGRELKVVRGPFSALVDLGRLELTLMLQQRYAGRFAIGLGMGFPKAEGTFFVRDKRQGQATGKLCIDLGNQVLIEGAADPRAIGRTDGRGAISLGDQDMEDVFGILSVGSRVVIQR